VATPPSADVPDEDADASLPSRGSFPTAAAPLFQALWKGPVALAIHRGSDHRIVDVNPAFSTMLGWRRDDAVGRTLDELGLVDPAAAETLDRLLAAARPVRGEEIAFWTRSGEMRHTLAGFEFVTLNAEPHTLSILVDISPRHRALAALAANEQRLRLALDAAQLGTFDWDLKTNRITWSRWHEELWGYAPGEFDGTYEAFEARIHPHDREAVRAQSASSMSLHQPYTCEYRVVWPDGSVHWIAGRGEFAFDASGTPVRMVGAVLETTARRKADERIRHLNRVHAVLSDINQTIVRAPAIAVVLDAACRIAVEKGLFEMAWIGRVDPAGDRTRIVAHAGADAATLGVVERWLGGSTTPCAFTARALGTGEHAFCNDIARDPDTAAWRDEALSRGYAAMASMALRAGADVVGTFNLYAGEVGAFDHEEMQLLDELASDISFALEVDAREAERVRIEHALRESEERFRELADNIQEVFWVSDPTRRQVLYVSRAFETIWGWPRSTLYATPGGWMDSVHPDDRPVLERGVAGSQSGGEETTYRIVRPDGRVCWIHERAATVRGPTGEIVRVVGTAEDVTARRQLEEQFRQAQKMEAIGQLAGGVAHDFNNILAAILMQADLAATAPGTPAETVELLEDIKASAERAANLTRQLLAFGRRQVMQLRVLDLNESVAALTKMLERIVGEDVPVHLSLHPAPLHTRADAGMLDQVLLNLVVNARDAMPDGGRLVIETQPRQLASEDAGLIPDALPGRYVTVRVTDTGCGIGPAAMPHIFEPFFTTKEQGKGTGLGLATVFGIVRQHGGWLTVESSPGRGTTFEVALRAEETAGVRAAEHALVSRRGAGTILLVEDEAQVRTLTRFALERHGYRVVDVPHGRAALRVWEEQRDAIDLVVTDLVMPEGVSGRELSARFRADRPDLPIVFTSGYSAEIAGLDLALQEGQNFLQKPFSPGALLEIVARSLAR
jgi:two-component system cell cycle sensor histidine kinase/response regulator CckA